MELERERRHSRSTAGNGTVRSSHELKSLIFSFSEATIEQKFGKADANSGENILAELS